MKLLDLGDQSQRLPALSVGRKRSRCMHGAQTQRRPRRFVIVRDIGRKRRAHAGRSGED
jgi:hypothetical protein